MTESKSTLPERDSYPDGVTCWVDVRVPDPDTAREFYSGLFGWEFQDTMAPDADGHYFVGRLRGRDVAAVGSQAEPGAPTAWNTYVAVSSADDAAKRAADAGGSVLANPFDIGDTGRMAVLADPQGAVLSVWQPGDFSGAGLVNEPGTWSFSGLTTTDPEAAISFYNRVFGWEADMDESGWSFFRVPGYAEHIEGHEPGFREGLAAQDAPPGFEDATAWLMSMDGQPEGTPPNWGVTFSVDDADASAARARELGGTVVVEPFDAPPVRTAVIADPQGAVFSVSKYTPPGD